MTRTRSLLLVSLLTLGCGRRSMPPRATGPGLYTAEDFTLILPVGATVRETQRSDAHEIAIVSPDDSSYTMFVARYQLSDSLPLRVLVRREFIADSVESKQNDWGVPGPVRRDSVGRLEAWSFEPTCGDCTMFNTYIARGRTVLRFQCIYSENTASWPSQRAAYASMLASFRWRGA